MFFDLIIIFVLDSNDATVCPSLKTDNESRRTQFNSSRKFWTVKDGRRAASLTNVEREPTRNKPWPWSRKWVSARGREGGREGGVSNRK